MSPTAAAPTPAPPPDRWTSRPLGRAGFVAWALGLFALKLGVDRLALRPFGHEGIEVVSYFTSVIPWPEGLNPWTDPVAFGLLLATSLPFLGLGCLLCLRRLRSAGLPPALVVLFVVPVMKWFLFVLLGLVPNRQARKPADPDQRTWRWVPDSTVGSAITAIAVSAALAMTAAVTGTEFLSSYGWGLFGGIPFIMGFMAAFLHGVRQPRTVRQSLLVAELAAGLVGLGFLVFAFEGVICLLMAAPLAMALACAGALVAHAIQSEPRRFQTQGGATMGCWAPAISLALMLGTEPLREGPPPLLHVTTSVDVAAPPERVWRHVVTFAELPPPTEAIFRLGIAYPLRAEIRGTGVGAVRECVFSTGAFVEPIQVWEEPRLLAFTVTENPAPMEEWTPYAEVHPPHLDGFLVSRRGQFRLEPLPGGGTRLEGTTWYQHTLWPAAYWQIWSDAIIHTIHRRVLTHVRNLAEADTLR